AGSSRSPAALATIAFALSPLFFTLQGVFLTDLPSLSFALIALALYERGRKAVSLPTWLLAALPATFAAITRQNMAMVPVAAAVVLWREPVLRRRLAWWIASAAPLALAVGIYAWFQQQPDARLLRFKFAEPLTILLAPYVVLIIAGLIALPLFFVVQKPRHY